VYHLASFPFIIPQGIARIG